MQLVSDLDASPFVETQFVVHEVTGKTAFVDKLLLKQAGNDPLALLPGEPGRFDLLLYVL